ncbi:MAG: DEAD/DEAH box helicase [Fibrobacterales bacterium]|nr:DEAD/DEAH box helicase [Fibrobacterales bacterium]
MLFEDKPPTPPFNDCASVHDAVADVRFSKIGAGIELDFASDERTHLLQCHAKANHGGKLYDVTSLVAEKVDHAVFDGVWFYFGNFPLVVEYLTECGIEELSHVSYAAYLNALKAAPEYPGIKISSHVEIGSCQDETAQLSDLLRGLCATLYPYQLSGFAWLRFVTDENCGCILGDEMGLGKTLQIIALLLYRHNVNKGPTLVVAPVSLLENWRREIARFAPKLKVLVHHGANRTGYYKDFFDYDVVIVAYSTIDNDSSLLCSLTWDVLVADEAQNIKNPTARRTKSIKNIPARAAIAVSGTPFENHISDIWSVVDFVLRGFLGKLADFLKSYPDTMEGADRIEPLLSPLMIRRLVKDVAKDLPEKVEIPVPLVMTREEAALYDAERRSIIIRDSEGDYRFAELMELRMYCAHPTLKDKRQTEDPILHCTKYERLCEMLEEIKSQNEKAMLFTSFTGMCKMLECDIPVRLGIPVAVINGATPASKRQDVVDAFNALPGCALLVLNPRAAATGLNITSANHVIHYNLEWNPAIEDQASARAYRRGQKKTVFIYRLYYANTVEEFVNDKICSKRLMSNAAVVGNVGDATSRQDYLDALKYSPSFDKGRTI